jgi:CrcB protein
VSERDNGPAPPTSAPASVYAAVALGSAIGGVLRALASGGIDRLAALGFPVGTLFVNITGSLVIGFYARWIVSGGRLRGGMHQRHFVMTGLCGGYTTFSAFSLETLEFLQAGAIASAGLNIGLSLATWLLAVWLGYALASRFDRDRHPASRAQ